MTPITLLDEFVLLSMVVKSVNGSYVFATDILNLGVVLGTPGSVNALQ